MAIRLVEKIKDRICSLRYRRLMVESVDGGLTGAAQSRLASHLGTCERCRARYDRQLFASKILSQYDIPEAAPDGKPEWAGQPATFNGGRRLNWKLYAPAAEVAALVVLIAIQFWPRPRATVASWDVVRLAGRPVVNSRVLTRSGKFSPGEVIETDSVSRAMVQVGAIGQVEIDTNTRLRLVKADAGESRIAIERGKIYATILAPPRLFFVETPSATAIDLGCAYTLEVGEAGESMLRVTSGWVELDLNGRRSLVPAGARCRTRPGAGPGTPCMEDATERFKNALELLDSGSGGAQEIETILAEARQRDALSLWHLLSRVGAAARVAIFERLEAFAPLPESATREGVLGLDQGMLDAWREKVEYVTVGIDPAKIPEAKGTLNPAGSMIDARFNHTATLLADGRVLIAGGREREGKILASAEIYDPATGEFTPAGEMTTRRVGHTATLMPDGRVLIAGGSTGDFYVGALSSAEIYDPVAGTFTKTGNLTQSRLAHQATPLADGRVLITGGQSEEWANRDSAEFYDPASGLFTAGAKMTEKRADHTATLLADGRVLVTGGSEGRFTPTNISATAEIYDPAKNSFTPAGSMSMVRFKHSAALLADGRVIILGGSNERMWMGRYWGAEIYDPTTGKFTPAGHMMAARYKIRDAVVPLRDGKVLVAGGGGRLEVFDPATGLFAAVRGGVGSSKLYATATMLSDGSVLIAGGYSGESLGNLPANSSVWIYRPD
jgi:hypothetical protein